MNQAHEPEQDPTVGLCATCRHVRVVESDRGSRFYFCDRSRTDPAFPRYPRLPVRTCAGYDGSSPPSFPVS